MSEIESELAMRTHTHTQTHRRRSVHYIECVEWQSNHQGNDEDTPNNQHDNKRKLIAVECALIQEDLRGENQSDSDIETSFKISTYTLAIHFSTADESETGVHKVLINKQKEKVESMESIALSVTQLLTPVSSERGEI